MVVSSTGPPTNVLPDVGFQLGFVCHVALGPYFFGNYCEDSVL